MSRLRGNSRRPSAPAAASGKEPFELARLADLLGEAPTELAPRAHELREKYYVGHKELRTLEEFAPFIREFAFDLHRERSREGSGVPHVAHLIGVSRLALEYGADEDEAIAALLHDAAEDQGGAATLAMIRNRYGNRVAEIVPGCSDTMETPKPEGLPAGHPVCRFRSAAGGWMTPRLAALALGLNF